MSMFKGTVWVPLYVSKPTVNSPACCWKIFAMDLSVLGIYSTVTEVGSYFQEKNDQYVACFFYRLLFFYGAWNFGFSKTQMQWIWECMNIRIFIKTLLLLIFAIYIGCSFPFPDRDFQMWNSILVPRLSLYLSQES